MYLITFQHAKKDFASGTFDAMAAQIKISSLQLDLTHETALLFVEFSSTHAEQMEISTKSTKDIERVFMPNLIINAQNYPIQTSDTLLIVAQSKSMPVSGKILNPDSAMPMKSCEIKKLIRHQNVTPLYFEYTIQSCRCNDRVYEDLIPFTYTKVVDIIKE